MENINKIDSEQGWEIFTKMINKQVQKSLKDELLLVDRRSATFTFNYSENEWEIKAVSRILDMGLVFSDMINKVFEFRKNSEEEEVFWNRFSKEVRKILEENHLLDLIEMIE